MKRVLIACAALAFFLVGLWSVAITDEVFSSLIENSLKANGIAIEASGVKKGLLFSFRISRAVLKKNERELLAIDNIEGSMNPFSMFLGGRGVHFRGTLSGGMIDGSIAVSKGTSALIRIDSADIEEIPFLKTSGIQGKGLLFGNLIFEKNSGTLKFDVKDARLNTASFSGIGIPLDMFRSAQGAMTISGQVIRITSFSLRGPGIYARLKGNITGNQLNALLELMPDQSFEKENVIFSVMGSFRTSPGYYSIPVAKTLE